MSGALLFARFFARFVACCVRGGICPGGRLFCGKGMMMLSMDFFARRMLRPLAVLVLPLGVFFASAAPASADGAVADRVLVSRGTPVAVTPYAREPLKVVQEKAEDGDGAAELELGLRYVLGSDGVRNVTAGVEWIRKAADRGIPQAEHELGSLYLMGVGVAQSDTMAVRWYERAANQGYAPSQTALGFAYEEGAGVQKDPELAAYWFEKAAAQHNGIAVESLEGGM